MSINVIGGNFLSSLQLNITSKSGGRYTVSCTSVPTLRSQVKENVHVWQGGVKLGSYITQSFPQLPRW